jgi:hypothetical protein
MKEVMVVNFKSPPFIGIGGRRWGKLTRFFLEQGIKVHLVHAKWGDSSELKPLDWMEHQLLLRYEINPGKLAKNSNLSLIDKLIFKCNAWKAHWLGEYSIFDEGRRSLSELQSTLNTIKSHNQIEAVFVTGPPFSWVTTVSQWSAQFQLPIWIDIRDPWLRANNWGMQNLSIFQRRGEEERYRSMFANAHFVSSPTMSLLDEIPLPQFAHKKVHLKHFFDWEDWMQSQGINTESDLVVYSGQFYVGMDTYMGVWKDIILEKKQVRWEIYSKDWKRFREYFNGMEQVKIYPDQGQQVFERLAAASALVICLAEYNKDFFTTKYYDYLPAQKPILYIGPMGKVAETLLNNQRNAVNTWFLKDNFSDDTAVFELPKGRYLEQLNEDEKSARGNYILELFKENEQSK